MSDRDQDAPRWTAARLQWLAIVVAGTLAGVLGFVGFWQYPPSQAQPSGLFDAIYRTVLLFMFQFEGELGPKPWALEVARFLAPAAFVAASSMAAASMRFDSRTLRSR